MPRISLLHIPECHATYVFFFERVILDDKRMFGGLAVLVSH